MPASRLHTETLIQGIDEALLISAYDIHFEFIADADSLRDGFPSSRYAVPRLLFIDSGWYEKSIGPESGPWYHDVGPVRSFEEQDYIALVDSLDEHLNAVVVSWDHSGDGVEYSDQIEKAQRFFGSRRRFNAEILLKPEKRRRYHDFRGLSPEDAGRLKAFDIVGVTEKELGDTVLRRLTTLATLRLRLDDAGVELPVHVFGGLDPLSTPLYFAAGAEVFDGLSWLRYAFRDGALLHKEAVPILDRQYEKRLAVALATTQLRNLDAISELARELKVCFHNGMDWDKLRNGAVLRHAYEAMESAIGGQHGR